MPGIDHRRHRLIRTILERQSGAIARWQLTWLGLTHGEVGLVLADMTPRHRGVHVEVQHGHLTEVWAALLAVCPRSLDAGVGLPPEEAAEAAVATAADAAIVTGWSAATLLGLTETASAHAHLLLDRAQNRQRDAIRLVRGDVTGEHWARHGELMVATPPRLLWDMAWTQRHDERSTSLIRACAVVADRTRRFAVDELLALVDEPAAFDLPTKVPTRLRAAAEDLRPGFSHSAAEAVGREVVTEMAQAVGLAVERRPFAITDRGRTIAEADIAITSVRHDVEIDGPHHEHPAQRIRDRRRDERMRALRWPWTVSRYPVAMLDETPGEFRRRIRRLVEGLADRAA